MNRLLRLIVFVMALAMPALVYAQAQSGPLPPGAIGTVQLPVERSDAATNVQHSHTSAATITLTAGAAGTNTQSIYITGIDISNCETGTIVTAAAPTYVTTTGLNGSPQYQIGSGPATAPGAGVCSPVSVIPFSAPLKSATPGTNVTFVMPTFVTNQVVSVNVYYRLGF